MAALTRGPLPPSVYWRRRLVVLTAAIVAIWVMAHLLGGGSGEKPQASADLSAAHPSPGSAPSGSGSPAPGTAVSASSTPSTTVSASPTTSPSPTVLPSPTGACPPSDVSVTPSVTNAVAGSPVTVMLTLQTFSTPACTWKVGRDTMQVKITTAGGSDVWSTVQCRSALPTSDLTLYRDTPTPVTLTWSSRESDDSCSTHTAWAQPGNYQVTGVALGGQPDEAPFALAAPTLAPKPSPTATATTSAKPTATAKASATVTTKSTPKASTSPSPTTRHQKHPVAD